MSIGKITYTLTKEDYLQHLLYASSKTPNIQNKRKIYKILLPVIYIVVAFIGLISGNMILFFSLAILSVFWWVFFPKWEKNLYTNRYSKFLDQQMSTEGFKQIEIDIQPEQIFQKEGTITYSIAYDQIRVIHEIQNYFYIGLKDGYTVIIPKNAISDIDAFKKSITEYTQELGIPQVTDLNWKWA